MRLGQVGRETLSRKFTVGNVWDQEPWRMDECGTSAK